MLNRLAIRDLYFTIGRLFNQSILNFKIYDLFSSAKKNGGETSRRPVVSDEGSTPSDPGDPPTQRLAKSTQQKDFTQSGQAQVLRRDGRRPFKPDFRILKTPP